MDIPNMDPLNSYNYSYTNYEHLPHNHYNMYNVKLEPPPQTYFPNLNNQYVPQYPVNPVNDKQLTGDPKTTGQVSNVTITIENGNQNSVEDSDTKENIKLIDPNSRKRKKGKTSNYWNKKIEDKNFPFYGCTICNVSFTTIPELDQHVTVHKGRVTSYDIRMRNQMKRKKKLKEMKRLKKLGKKMKKEKKEQEKALDVEIKPEDGYIGNEKASEYNDSNNFGAIEAKVETDNVKSNKAESLNTEEKVASVTKVETEDPRLQKLFKCFACHKQFALSYYLKLHVRSHTDEKPYTCAECGQSFITASKLGRHTKRIHLAVKFQCRICFRYFNKFAILTRHFDKIHNEEKLEGEPYDYNAILPYIKELEEQFKVKSTPEEIKSNTEKVWVNCPQPSTDGMVAEEIVKDDTIVDDVKCEDDDHGIPSVPPPDDDMEPFDIKEEEPKDGASVDDKGMMELNVSVRVERDCDNGFTDEDNLPVTAWATKTQQETDFPFDKPSTKKYFPSKCELCDKLISSRSYYKVHLLTHSGEKPFKCYICNRGFITTSKMHRHVLTHTDVENVEAIKTESQGDECIKSDNYVPKKRARRRTKKPKEEPLVKQEDGVVEKVRGSKKRPHACPYCNKRFLHVHMLKVHEKTHEGEDIVYKCTYCLEVMGDQEQLKVHEATHGGPKPYLCTVCGKVYTKKEAMMYHRKSHGVDCKPEERRPEFICDICSKSFNAQCKLRRHMVSHRVDKFVLRYECPVCAHMFNTKYHIQMHLTTHQKEGLIMEENRNEVLAMVLQNARKIPKTSDSGSLSELIPADGRSQVCNICGQVFQHFYFLEEHLKSHSSKIAIEESTAEEEKKHICPVCNKGFKLHYYLKLHSFTHTKEKPFACEQCGKGFITKGKLKRHLETHTGIKKYQCYVCYKFFTRPSYLRIHVRTIHGTQDYNFRSEKTFLGMESGLANL